LLKFLSLAGKTNSPAPNIVGLGNKQNAVLIAQQKQSVFKRINLK